MNKDNKRKQADLTARAMMEASMGAILGGKVRREDSEANISGFVNKLKDATKETPKTNPNRSQTDSDGVYVADLSFPGDNITYICLVDNGNLLMSTKDNKIDLESLKSQGCIGHTSLDSALSEIFSESSIPKMKQRKSTPRPPPDPTKTRTPPRKPKKITYMIDPKLVDLLREKRQYIISRAFGEGSGTKSPKYEEKGDLIGIGMNSGMLEKLVNAGITLSLIDPIGFVKNNKRKVQKSRKARLQDLMRRDIVNDTVRSFEETLGYPDKMPDFYDALMESRNARIAFKYFHDDHPIENIATDEMIDVLRYTALQHAINDSDIGDKISRSLGQWLNVIKAAQHVEMDDRINSVVHHFEDAKTSSKNTANEQIYEGMRCFLKDVISRKHHYTHKEVGFIANGLWFLEYFPKVDTSKTSDKDGDGSEIEDEGEPIMIDRPIGSAMAQFVSPAKHLMRRYDLYNSRLGRSFDRLLELDKISEDTGLNSRAEDYALGFKLYENIPQATRTNIFTRFDRKDVPLRPARGIGYGGRSVEAVLAYYVGVNRERFLEAIDNHYDNK